MQLELLVRACRSVPKIVQHSTLTLPRRITKYELRETAKIQYTIKASLNPSPILLLAASHIIESCSIGEAWYNTVHRHYEATPLAQTRDLASTIQDLVQVSLLSDLIEYERRTHG